MDEVYFVEDDIDSIEDMAKILMTIREEFTATANESQTLWSEAHERLKLLNVGMAGQREKFSNFYEQLRDNESSDEEDEAQEDDEEAPDLLGFVDSKQSNK